MIAAPRFFDGAVDDALGGLTNLALCDIEVVHGNDPPDPTSPSTTAAGPTLDWNHLLNRVGEDRPLRDVEVPGQQRAAEAAAILRVRYFVIHPGPEQAGARPPEERLQRMENTVAVLDQVAGELARRDRQGKTARDLAANAAVAQVLAAP